MKMTVILASIFVLITWAGFAEAGNIITAQWSQLPGGLARVSTGNAGVWGISNYHQIYKLNPDGRAWTQISGGLAQISSGASVWGVNRNDYIYKYIGNNQWQGIGGKLSQVAVSNKDRVWGVNRRGTIYRWKGNGWEQIDGAARQVSVGESGVWIVNWKTDGNVNYGHQIYYRTGTFGDVDTAGSGWQRVDGGLKWVSSGRNIVVGVNYGNEVLYRKAVSSHNPIGTRWVKVPGRMNQIEVAGDQAVGVSNYGNSVYKCPVVTDCFCNDVNDQEFDLTDVVYDVENGAVTTVPPEHVGVKTLENRSSERQQAKLVVVHASTETHSFTHTSGASVKVGTSFKAKVPFVFEKEINVEVTTSYEFSSGTTKSSTKSVTADFLCTGAPFKITDCETLLFRDRWEVPYTRTWTEKEDRSCVCTDSGVFTEIAGSRLEMNITERPVVKRK